MKFYLLLLSVLFFPSSLLLSQKPTPTKPRVIVSTDIGGTDPDDNQSIIHLFMYSEKFNLEGLISSPSYGEGDKKEIHRMINLYEKDFPALSKHQKNLATPQFLRTITKQGAKGLAPFKGYVSPTEGSEWIIKSAKKKSKEPLWILVWGGLEDVAQALHDAPEIQKNIKVFWIGGPNKKWSANSYAYIVANFPDLWFVESNSSYYGFFSDHTENDISNKNYYKNYINEAGFLGKDFKANRYRGNVKMGDTPSLLYMMDGDPNNPEKESWGGSYEKFTRSPRTIYERNLTLKDTVAVFSIAELRFKGPKLTIDQDKPCFKMVVKAKIGEQSWDGYYVGDGNYALRYIPKQTETINYEIRSDIKELDKQSGQFFVSNVWPGKPNTTDYILGKNYYTDKQDPELYDNLWQGGKTVLKWRSDVLRDWAKRWQWLK
ncbi:nucleoside hydrolase-like domain-containing protein [Chryseobacterium sp.]|uniref:nucleoside hydrolase-like domain-containing protein n=1 Tax=Chryseobacterium sp. TaxID=1871047 RepID=UPI00289D7218|nr:nucleoside hydrolase-like domain-containing protein [Chryseobacterium sp.]